MPKTQQDTDPRSPILSAVRESQTALVDMVRGWTDITEQLTRHLPLLPVAGIDVADAVDRAFDLAEQTLAAQRQFTLTLVGVVDRQLDRAVEAVEVSANESLQGVEDLLEAAEDERQPDRQRSTQPAVAKATVSNGESRKRDAKQASKVDRRPFEERSVEELRDRARELEIEGRSAMSKDELVAALRAHAK